MRAHGETSMTDDSDDTDRVPRASVLRDVLRFTFSLSLIHI